jgi:hypothetical protein
MMVEITARLLNFLPSFQECCGQDRHLAPALTNGEEVRNSVVQVVNVTPRAFFTAAANA